MCPRPPNIFPLLDSSPCPQHPLDAASEGEALAAGLACTSQDGEGLPPSRPALGPGLDGLDRVKEALSPSPGGTALRFPRSDFVGGLRPSTGPAPSSDALPPRRPSPGLGESRWCAQGLVCLPRFSGLQAACAAGRRDLQCRPLPRSLLPLQALTAQDPAPAPRPERPEAGVGGGRREGGRGAGQGPAGGPSRAFSSAVPVSLPKSLEKFLSLPASQPLKAGERGRGGGGRGTLQPRAVPGSGSNSLSNRLPRSSRYIRAASLSSHKGPRPRVHRIPQ